MDAKQLAKYTLVIAAIAVIFAAGAFGVVLQKAYSDDGPKYDKYTLYVGTDAVDRAGVEAIQTDILNNIVLQRYDTGFTSYIATGDTYSGGMHIIDDYTIVFVFGLKESKDAGMMNNLINDIKAHPHTAVILVEKQKADNNVLL